AATGFRRPAPATQASGHRSPGAKRRKDGRKALGMLSSARRGSEMDGLRQWVREQIPDLVAWRRHLHANPEPSFQEEETARYIRRHLEELGLAWTNPAGHGTVAVVQGEGPGPTVALRADIDALP